ncbi:NADP-dependent oxidoreductase [Kitasatospora phosalacinea]|uniref:NADP-dependent oxidoreductase n=1 Tax=Kitasatospora phosalacinea TaxID=2065 RepID=UPI000689C50D|nr:NADP-dependent oxidoreductase [Kitasatospora phosalacinea]
MRAVILRSFGGPEVLEVADVPVPVPGPGQVRVRVTAAAVNPVDLQTRSGALTAAGLLPARPVTGLGWDVSGTVDALGPGVTGFRRGEPVIGLSDRLGLSLKAQAEQVVLDADALAPLPEGLDPVASAGLPLGALTAAQALDLAALRPGSTLLVTGAAGSVGGFAVQLAVRAGLRVVAAAGDADGALVRGLGAETFVPRSADLAAAVREAVPSGVDAALDAASLGPVALDAVRGGGTLVAVLGTGPAPLRGTRVTRVWIRADGPRLAALATAGLTPRTAGTLPLDRVAEAHRRLESGPLRGRLLLLP